MSKTNICNCGDLLQYSEEQEAALLDILHWAMQCRIKLLIEESSDTGGKAFFGCCDQATRDVLERARLLGLLK